MMTTSTRSVPGAGEGENVMRVARVRDAGRRVVRYPVRQRAGEAASPVLRVADRSAGPRADRAARPRVVVRRARVRRCESPAAPSLHGSRLTMRGRLVVALVWLLLGALAAVPILGERGADGPAETVPVRVEPGDTLWQLAKEIDPTADPRSLVNTIIEVNDLSGSGDIHPGETVLIPVGGG